MHIEKLIEAHEKRDECVEAAKATELRILLYKKQPLSIVYRVRLNIAEWQMDRYLVQQFGSNTTDPLGMSSVPFLKADYAEIPEAVFDEETYSQQTRKTSFCIAVRVLATPITKAVQDSNIAVKGIGPKDLQYLEFFVGYASTLINYITAEEIALVTSSLTFNKQTVLQLLDMINVQALRPFLEQCIDRDIGKTLEVKGLRNASMLEYVIASMQKAKPVADLSTEIVKYLHSSGLEPQFQNLQELVGSVQGKPFSFEATNLKNQLSSNCDSIAAIRYCKGKRMPIPNMLAMLLPRRSPVAAM
ncbi:hypothetical protein SPFM20_00231 [Salmonella phage SPFM20]|nr:hypothetical protein SPFM8_00231 [Salmonella phage SPFM8]VFR14909.1 hypothetical protein SPFM20_00231 [Salmonella phage SPFM20]